ncbi:hypothetical protein [Candidatus Korarchaeum cryptofilum]|jgi:hypothetical protein|uniref:hypothetical protein n=1 Tax=Candidatus Korarchaeum cryptofilum TaxID=498846 RepID=UPI00163D25DD|nr:hypothetical protein [Candidatus Korarchaeum cryptofilum]
MRVSVVMVANAIIYNLGVALLALGIAGGAYVIAASVNLATLYLISHLSKLAKFILRP